MSFGFDISDLPRPLIRYGVGLWRRRWVVVAGAWAAACLGWFGLWLLPDKYESRAQLHVQTESILEPVMTGITARPNYEQRVETMRQQLLTRPNVEEIIYRAGLDRTVKARSDLDRRRKMERLVNWVAGEIEIESPQNLYFVISYKSGDPVVARNVVDAVLNLLIEQDLGVSLAEKEEARRLLDGQIKEFDDKLTAKEREVADFRRAHGEELAIVEGKARERERLESDLSRVRDQLSQEQRRAATLKTTLAGLPRASAGAELDQLKVQLAQLQSQYHENYPDIRALKARIGQLENTAAGALPRNPDFTRARDELRGAEDQVAGLLHREESLRADLEALAVAIGDAPGVEADLSRIIRDYEQTQKSYEELIQRRDRLSLTANLGAGGQGVEYQVFERPDIALTPVSPPRLLLILGVLIVAIGAGAGLGVAQVYLDRTYTQADDLKAFGLPVLGSIGVVGSDFLRQLRRRDFVRLGAASAALAAVSLLYIYLAVIRLPAGVDAARAESAGQATFAEAQ